MKARIASFAAALIMPLAHASSLSYVGALDAQNPNDVFLVSFTLAAESAIKIQTWSFGGGTNAAGSVIASGGFDPYVSLFSGDGAGATFLASNDDGQCPPGQSAPACADSTLITGLLAAGTYTLALTTPFNFSFAENYGSGTLGDGFIGLAASFDDGSCAATCTSAYAVDVSDSAPVPEPPTWLLLGIGAGMLGLARRRRTAAALDFCPPHSSTQVSP